MKRIRTRALSALVVAATLSLPFSTAIKAHAEGVDTVECALAEDVKVSSRLFELLFGKREEANENKSDELSLCPGGDVFGIRIKDGKVTVMESSGSYEVKAGDVILAVNGRSVSTIEDVKKATADYKGGALRLRIMRGGEELNAELTPMLDGDSYKLGLSLRDGAAGIGTVTFVDPETGDFAGLGHGICDAENGKLVEMKSGSITGVILGGVKRGECGKPGELCGVLTPTKNGTLYANTECGVFGKLDTAVSNSEAIPIAERSTVHEGDATIISTVKNGKKCEFSVKIFDVDSASEGTKSFKIKVTDPVLIGLTGGIIRGMGV